VLIALSLKNITKSYGTDVILKDVSFSINEGEKVGLVGVNGAGKTTLFKVLCSTLTPDSGEIYIQKDKKLGYLSQSLDLDEDSTIFEETLKVFGDIKSMEQRMRELEHLMSQQGGEENASSNSVLLKEYGHLQDEYERCNGYGCESFARGMLIGLGIQPDSFDKEIRYLSGGLKTRVALSKLLLKGPDILLLDEPTNHLDLDALAYLEGFLKDYKGTVIVISHDRYFLDVITTRTLELTSGITEDYNGNYSSFISQRQKRYEDRMNSYEEQQKEIKRLEDIIERYRSYNREKSIRQAESREKSLARIERLDKPSIDTSAARVSFDIKYKSGNDVIIIENIEKSFGELHLFHDLSFMIRRGERVALIGQNGKGKTTIFKILCGLEDADSGYVRLGKNVDIGYYEQEQKNLSLDKTVIDEVWDDYPDMTVTQVRNVLAAFLFTGDDVFKPISSLSGGERCRVSLLKVMLSKANLLLLDEPTNHLDILSREAVEDALLSYEGTLFVISHDRYFLNKVINRILVLEDQVLTEYPGGFQYYMEKKTASPDEIVVSTVGKTKTEIKEERRKLREEQEKQKELKRSLQETEDAIEKAEKELHEKEQLMCLPEVYSDPEKSVEVTKDLKALRELSEKLYAQWEEYTVLLENEEQ
jgi:ATP-binding cassette subfamily F protein 3